MPKVELFYAVKTNPDSKIVERCHNLGTGFDVASTAEMEMVKSFGVDSENLIFANPVKSIEDLKTAKKFGIKKMTFDSIEELYKIKKIIPSAECVLRIATDASMTTALYNLNEKFGVTED
jgi:ornithine decarboxylase